jgi:hypothetical protein
MEDIPMLRTRRRFQASLESLEGKALLSTLPILSQQTFNQVLHQIDRAAGTFAKTHNPTQFDAALSSISTEVPYGHSQLYPTWQSDEGIYDPTVPGSGMQMVQQLKADLKDYVQTAVADGTIGMRGSFARALGVRSNGTPVVPLLTHQTYTSVLKQIDRAAGTFAKTHNSTQFDAALSSISTKVPYGHSQLYPTWQSDEGIYDPTVPGSGMQMVQQLKADLKDYVMTSIADASIRYR